MKELKKNINYEFKDLGKQQNYVLFISPTDYFGTNGYKIYISSLLEAYWIIDTPSLDTMYIRLQNRFGKHMKRILFSPVSNGERIIDGDSHKKYTERILNVLNKLF